MTVAIIFLLKYKDIPNWEHPAAIITKRQAPLIKLCKDLVKLRRLRKQQGLTLEQLASEFGHANHSYLSEVEIVKKKPSMELVITIAKRFVSTNQLLIDELELD